MSVLNDYLNDLAPLVNLDAGTANTAGVTRAAEITKALVLPANSSIWARK